VLSKVSVGEGPSLGQPAAPVLAGCGYDDAGTIQIDLFVWLPIRRAQANHIAFVRDHVDELILLKKSLMDE
jgi:hypothetical protein